MAAAGVVLAFAVGCGSAAVPVDESTAPGVCFELAESVEATWSAYLLAESDLAEASPHDERTARAVYVFDARHGELLIVGDAWAAEGGCSALKGGPIPRDGWLALRPALTALGPATMALWWWSEHVQEPSYVAKALAALEALEPLLAELAADAELAELSSASPAYRHMVDSLPRVRVLLAVLREIQAAPADPDTVRAAPARPARSRRL